MTSDSTKPNKIRAEQPRESEPRVRSGEKAERFFFKGVGTILVTEDEDAVRNVIHLGLEAQGFQVLSTNRPSEALRLFEQNADSISLLLTDVVMPEFSGRDLYQKLLKRNPQLKVLYVSGYPDDVLMMYGITRHDFSLMRKPFSPKELAMKIIEVLARD